MFIKQNLENSVKCFVFLLALALWDK